MSGISPTGPPVADHEDAYRAILHDAQWHDEAKRPSSAALDDEVFSVDIASRTTPQTTKSRFRSVLHIVQFGCGAARGIGFDTRDELDPIHPDNRAHANVYFLDYHAFPAKKRKAKARELAQICSPVEF